MPTQAQFEYQRLRAGLLKELGPVGILEEVFAVEMIQAFWRLRQLDLQFHANPEQNEADLEKHDRARSRANSILRRSAAELRRLQTERRLREQLSKEEDLTNVPPLAEIEKIQAARLLNRRLKGLHDFESLLRHADQKAAEELPNLQNTKQTQ